MRIGILRRAGLGSRRAWMLLLLVAIGGAGVFAMDSARPAAAVTTQVFITPHLRVAPETIVGFTNGPTISADVRVQDVIYAPTPEGAGLGDFEFTITFRDNAGNINPNVATILNATEGSPSFLGLTGRSVSCTSPVIAPGSVNFSCNTLASAPAGPLGSGVLATITFQPGANFGSANLRFDTSQLDDITGDVPITNTALTGAMLIGKCGDFNGDHAVTVGDILLMILRFGSNQGPPPTANWDPRFDVNNDGRVNVADLVIEGQEFGRSCIAP